MEDGTVSLLRSNFDFREPRGGRSSLFDGIEEGGIRAAPSYSHEINEHENERALEGLQDRVILLKRVSLPLILLSCSNS